MAGIPYASSVLPGFPSKGSCPASQTPASAERGCFGPCKGLSRIQLVPSRILMGALGATDGLVSLENHRRSLREARRTPPARARAHRPSPPRAARAVGASAAASRVPRRSPSAEQMLIRGQQGRLFRRQGDPRRPCTRRPRDGAAPAHIPNKIRLSPRSTVITCVPGVSARAAKTCFRGYARLLPAQRY